jgi:RNA polymerase sigma factor (sigma-70 family)
MVSVQFMDTTSGTLLERLRSPADLAAWERFVLLYTPFLYRCGRKFGLKEQDTADVVQDVFSILLLKLPQFHYQSSGSFRGWLKTVLHNKCREHDRRKHEVAVGGSEGGLSSVASDESFSSMWDTEYRQHVVMQALKVMQTEFEPATWQACWLYIVEDRPVAEVAAELGLSSGSVYTYTSRVLRRLRHELQHLVE